MFKLFDSGLCPIGIDAGTHAVRLLQLRKSGNDYSLQAACRIELDSLDDGAQGAKRLVAAVRHALGSHDFKGKRVVVSLPVSCVNAKSVRLPPMPDSDLSQALQWEAKDRFGFEVGEGAAGAGAGTGGQIVWFRAGEVRRGTEVKDELLLFAVEGGVLGEYVRGLSSLGPRVEAVDLAHCAAQRSFSRAARGQGAPPPGTGAMLDIGHAGAQFFITRGEELVFFKHIDIGGKTINETVAAKLGITPGEASQMRSRLEAQSASEEEAAPLSQALRDAMRGPLEELARELDMCMRYYVVTFRGSRPESIIVSGRQSACTQLRETLAGALGLQVEESQPLRGVHDLGEAARPDRSSEWAVAAGLSLYPIGAGARRGAAA